MELSRPTRLARRTYKYYAEPSRLARSSVMCPTMKTELGWALQGGLLLSSSRGEAVAPFQMSSYISQ